MYGEIFMDGSIEKSSITRSRKTAQSVLSDAELSPANEKTLTDFLYDDGGY